MKLIGEIITDRLSITDARESDIGLIIEAENRPANRNFVWQGTYEEHLAEIHSDNQLLLVFRRAADDEPVGCSLSRVDLKSEVFELRRIIIADKGKGYGREAMLAHFKYAFEQLGVNRFWLDAYPDNKTGISLYESLGMHRDGVLRQHYKSERGYLDQIVFSVLKSEYLFSKDNIN